VIRRGSPFSAASEPVIQQQRKEKEGVPLGEPFRLVAARVPGGQTSAPQAEMADALEIIPPMAAESSS